MKKIVLYLSAFVPMYFLFALNLIVEIINNNLSFNITNTCVLIFLVCCLIIGTFGLFEIVNNKKVKPKEIKITKIHNITDEHFLNYFSLFVLLALAFDLSKLSSVCVFVSILVFIGIVYIRNNIFYINPLLNIFGYSFYDVECEIDGEVKELRIFFKGRLDKNEKYYLYENDSNLIFVQKNDNN